MNEGERKEEKRVRSQEAKNRRGEEGRSSSSSFFNGYDIYIDDRVSQAPDKTVHIHLSAVSLFARPRSAPTTLIKLLR